MASSFFGLVKNSKVTPKDNLVEQQELRSVFASSRMKVVVINPRSPEKTCQYADSLKAGTTLILEYSLVDPYIQQTMHDFLAGVCYIIGGSSQVLSANVRMYMPAFVEMTRNISASTLPPRPVFLFDKIAPVNRFSSETESHYH